MRVTNSEGHSTWLIFTDEDPVHPPSVDTVTYYVFGSSEWHKVNDFVLDFKKVSEVGGRKVVPVVELDTRDLRTLTIVLDDPNVSYGAPPCASARPAEEVAESSDSEGGNRRPQKKPSGRKLTQEEKDRRCNTYTFLLQASNPVAQFFKGLTEAVNNGSRHLVGSGSYAKFANKLKLRVGYGKGQSKWKYSVLKKVEELVPELFKSRNVKYEAFAPPLTDEERIQLEAAFQVNAARVVS